jgi:hypothetical protein
MNSIDAQQVTFTRGDPPYHGEIYMMIWHDKGRSILVLDDNGRFVPLDKESGGALADLLKDLG